MKILEERSHSFIVRIWLEPREIHGVTPEWRAVIEHVESGERRYLRDLDAIEEFIVPYLRRMGAEVGKIPSKINWFNQLKSKFRVKH